MAPRRPLAWLLLVFLFALLATNVHADSSTMTTTTTTTTANSTSQSFCELCRDKGNCAQAYKGSPGIFCGSWLSQSSQRVACCCPATGQCAKTQSNYQCMCSGGSISTNNTPSSSTTPKPLSSTTSSSASLVDKLKKWIFIAIAVIIVGMVAGSAFMWARRRQCHYRHHSSYDGAYIVEQPAVYAQPVMGHAPQYAPHYAPQYAPGYVKAQPHHHQGYHGYHHGDGGGYSGAMVAAGAAVGLVGGMVIGDMIADAGDHGGNTYNVYNGDGGGGGGGGDMFAGDF